jgi:hypothetical protein
MSSSSTTLVQVTQNWVKTRSDILRTGIKIKIKNYFFEGPDLNQIPDFIYV